MVANKAIQASRKNLYLFWHSATTSKMTKISISVAFHFELIFFVSLLSSMSTFSILVFQFSFRPLYPLSCCCFELDVSC